MREGRGEEGGKRGGGYILSSREVGKKTYSSRGGGSTWKVPMFYSCCWLRQSLLI